MPTEVSIFHNRRNETIKRRIIISGEWCWRSLTIILIIIIVMKIILTNGWVGRQQRPLPKTWGPSMLFPTHSHLSSPWSVHRPLYNFRESVSSPQPRQGTLFEMDFISTLRASGKQSLTRKLGQWHTALPEPVSDLIPQEGHT